MEMRQREFGSSFITPFTAIWYMIKVSIALIIERIVGGKMIYYIIFAIALLFLIFVIYLVLKKKLLLKYSILWILYSIGLVVMSISVKLINDLATVLNIYYAPSMIFLFGLFFLMIYMLHLSIVVTKQNNNMIKLTQELSLMKNREEKNK